MLKAAGIRCDVNTHFLVSPDGLGQLECMNNMVGNLWEKKRVKIVCSALSLPFPLDSSKPGGSGVAKETDKANSMNLEPIPMNKLLLVGCDQSGTSTIFKQGGSKIQEAYLIFQDFAENYQVTSLILNGKALCCMHKGEFADADRFQLE